MDASREPCWDEAPLPRCFYNREPDTVAQALIGQVLVRQIAGTCVPCRIVEAEAYRGREDAASHARSGKTPRNYPMFGPPGHAYVYFIYGMHWMFNIAAHTSRSAGAVLIRAVEPLAALDLVRRLRGGRVQCDYDLTNGPAKLTQALGITREHNDVDLCAGGGITVVEGYLRNRSSIACGPRLRVPGDGSAKSRPWRFWIQDSPWVSY